MGPLKQILENQMSGDGWRRELSPGGGVCVSRTSEPACFPSPPELLNALCCDRQLRMKSRGEKKGGAKVEGRGRARPTVARL